MSPDTPLFGRLTVGGTRTSLGRANVSTLMIRAMEQIRKVRHRDDLTIQLEMSPSKLPDSTTFDKQAFLEQQIAKQIAFDLEAESPFPNLTMRRVAEAMESAEYEAFAAICEPSNRIGISATTIAKTRELYVARFPDCAPHFPQWID